MNRRWQRWIFGLGLGLTVGGGLSQPKPAIADSWVRVYTDRVQNYVVYVDKSSIRKEKAIRYFWVNLAKADGSAITSYKGKAIQSFNLFYSADCQKKLVRLRTIEVYDSNGQRIQQSNAGDGGPLGQMTTDTPVTKGLTNYVCAARR